MERRLAAILAADVAGYTRLMGLDEAGTLQRLTKLRELVLEPLIETHHGRIVKVSGDGFLVEFASVVDAVTCAVAWQNSVADRESRVDRESRLLFRIGINVGDVIVEGDDIHGDGVNLAARLEGEAQPGGICVSGDAFRQVKGKVELDYSDLGERRLKNVVEPVQIFSIVQKQADTAVGKPGGKTQPLIDKPSIAILPFYNMSGNPEQEYFADGISEDIITGLSRNPDVYVISRNSSFRHRGKSVDVRMVSDALGARYILEGSVRKAGMRVRVNAQLIDAQNDRNLWAERYDRDLDDIFAVQDEIVGSIVHALGATDGVLEKTARKHATNFSVTDPTAYDCYLRAREHFYRPGDSGFEDAEILLEKAIETDPKFAPAYSSLAWLYFVRFKLYFGESFEAICKKSLDLALKSVRLDANDYRGHWVLGAIYLHQGKHSKSLAEFDRALQINPNDANLLNFSTEPLIYSGQPEEALQRCLRAIRLNPSCPDVYWWQLGFSYFHLGRYGDAANALEHMTSPTTARRLLAATYAHLGRHDEANAEAREYLKNFPDFTISEWAKSEPYAEPEELQRYVAGLKLAGLPT